MEQTQLTQVREDQFNKAHCKITTDDKAINDIMQKGRILEAELHKELLDRKLSVGKLTDNNFTCSRENCKNCPSLLC